MLSYFKFRVILRDLYHLEQVEKDIAKSINNGDYDVVILEQDSMILTPVLLKYLKKPVVYYCQQPSRSDEVELQKLSPPIEKKSFRQKLDGFLQSDLDKRLFLLEKEYASFSTYTLANSYFSRENILRRYGLNAYVSYHGININVFKFLNLPRQNYVLSVGAMSVTKGFDFIIKSLVKLDQEKRPLFIIVSDRDTNDWGNYITHLANELGVDLEIKMMISNEELVNLYNQAKIVLYTPYLEPFGLIPLEAMACGVPVIAVKEGGMRESIIDSETGLLVDRDEEKFAHTIEDLLNDENKQLTLSENGLRNIENYWTADHAGERYLQHLISAIKLFNK